MLVYFDTAPNSAAALEVTRDKVDAAFAGRASLLEGVEFAFGSGVEDWNNQASQAEVIFLGAHHHWPGPNEVRSLAWVHSVSSGIEGINKGLPERVKLTNSSGVHADKGAEFILTAALMINYNIPRFADDKLHRRWQPNFGSVLRGKKAVLLGTGAIGGAAAKLLRGFGVETVGVNRSGSADGFDVALPLKKLDDILSSADFLISSLPLTRETTGLVSASRIGLLSTKAGVIVVGRSRVFDYDALAEALASGRIAGAVLDVFDQEPLPKNDPLWSCPGLIMTPHCSLDDHKNYLNDCLRIFVENFARYRAGLPLSNLVDRRLGY